MIRLAVVGDIGSGKSYVAKQFGYPVFNADAEVSKIYKKDKKCYRKLKRSFPDYITKFPVKKSELKKAIASKRNNLRKISRIVHPIVRQKLKIFMKKKKNMKFVILDIPLLLENKINKKEDILIFVDAKKKEINKRLKKKHTSNHKFLRKFQLPVEVKKEKSDFVVKNNFRSNSIKKNVKIILKEILVNA